MSTWNQLATLNLSEEWQYTSITEDNVFRFTYSEAFNIVNVLVAQAELGDINQLFDLRKLAVREESEIITITKPPFFESRRIGLKIIPFSDKKPPSLIVTLESLYMPLVNPIDLTSIGAVFGQLSRVASESDIAEVTVDNTAVGFLGASENRRGFHLWNGGTTVIYIGLGEQPTTSLFSFKLEPGGYYEGSPYYQGSVFAISSATGGKLLVSDLTA